MLSTTQGAAVPSVVFKSFVLNALGRSLQPVWKYFFVQYAFCRHILVQRCALQRPFQFRGREGTTAHQGCTSGWAYQLLRGSALFWLTPPIFPGPPHLTPFPSRAHALPIQPWIRPVTMEAGIGLGTTLNHTIHAPALTSGFSW